eukprot:4132314-Prymnesium_polylepis.1
MSQEQYASIGALLKVLPARIFPHLWRLFAVRKPVANSLRTPWRGSDRGPRGRGVTSWSCGGQNDSWSEK